MEFSTCTWEEKVAAMSQIGDSEKRTGKEYVSRGGKSNRFFRLEKLDYTTMTAHMIEYGVIIGEKIGRLQGENVYDVKPCFSMPIGRVSFPVTFDEVELRPKRVISSKEFIPLNTIDEIEKIAKKTFAEEDDVMKTMQSRKVGGTGFVKTLSRMEEQKIRAQKEEFERGVKDEPLVNALDDDWINQEIAKMKAMREEEWAARKRDTDFWSTDTNRKVTISGKGFVQNTRRG